MYSVIFFGFIIGATAAPPDCKSVGPGKYPGETCSQYYECTKSFWWYNVKLQECSAGHLFDTSSKKCSIGFCDTPETAPSTQTTSGERTTTVISTETSGTTNPTDSTSTVATPSSLSTQGATASTESTEENVSTTVSTKATNPASTTNDEATASVTITATPSNDSPPDCKSVGAGYYPAKNCSKYYRCTKVMWWYNINLETCPNGQVFNVTSKNCAEGTCNSPETPTTEAITPSTTATAAATTNAETADLTTTAATTTTEATASASTTTADTTEAITTSQTTIPPMTTLKPDKPPNCKSVGAGNYPAQKCNQYYKCTKIMWWYNIQLQTCRNGRIFDLSSRRCERGSCSSPTEISSPATTAAKSSAATIRTTAATPPTTL